MDVAYSATARLFRTDLGVNDLLNTPNIYKYIYIIALHYISVDVSSNLSPTGKIYHTLHQCTVAPQYVHRSTST
jgi:hypothetical protein